MGDLRADKWAVAAWLGDAVAAVLFALALTQLLAPIVAGDSINGFAGLGWALLLVVAASLRGLAQGLAAIVGLRHGSAMTMALRSRIAPLLMTGAAGHGRLAGADAELAVAGIDRLEPYVARFLPLRRAAVVSPLLIVLAAFLASPVSGGVLLMTLLPFAIGMALVGTAARVASDEQLSALSRLGGLFVDRVRALPLILSYGAEDRVTRQIGAAAHELATRTLGVLRIAFVSSAVLEFFSALAVALVAVYCGFSLLGLLPFPPPEELDFARAFFVLALAPEFYVGMRRLAAAYHDKQQGEAVLTALSARAEVTEQAPPPPVDPGRAPVLAVSNWVVKHPDGAQIGPVEGIWRTPGLHIISGPSGSGKTSLLRALIGQVPMAAGELRLNDAVISPGTLVPHCGWAGQRPLLLPGTLRSNLLLDRWGRTEGEALVLLDILGLGPLLAARGGGLDWTVDDRGSGLSGGERRRIGLARALLAPRPFLLLDEPTADLDAATAGAVIGHLRQAAQARILIVATHDPALTACGDSQMILS